MINQVLYFGFPYHFLTIFEYFITNYQPKECGAVVSEPAKLRTRRVYLFELEKFVEFADRNPDELVELGKKNSEEAHHFLKLYYNTLALASTTKIRIYQTIRSFYRANGVILEKNQEPFELWWSMSPEDFILRTKLPR